MPIRNKFARVARHFTEDIWRTTGAKTVLGRLLERVSRLVFIALHGFMRDNCLLRASALTYTTILSIVPFLAVAFSISAGLGLQNTEFIRTLLTEVSAGRAEVVEHILGYINQTNVRTLGWVGMVTLLATILSVVGTVESSFNAIFNVRKGRTFWRKFTDFFSVSLVCPVIMVAAASLTVSLHGQSGLNEFLRSYGMDFLLSWFFRLLPYIMVWIGFVFAYVFIPNTYVGFKGAVAGGLVATLLWQGAQYVYINYQIGVAKYNAIYGSFSQFPLFLIWLYISWSIVLFGAEVAYAVHSLRTVVSEKQGANASLQERQKVSVAAMAALAFAFESGLRPPSICSLAAHLGLPQPLLADSMDMMEQAGLVLKVEDSRFQVYALARPPEAVRVMDVIRATMDYRRELNGSGLDLGLAEVNGVFTAIGKQADAAEGNLSLVELARELAGQFQWEESGAGEGGCD